MRLLFKILFFLIVVFQVNTSEAKVFVFGNVISEIKFTVDYVENKNKSNVLSENEIGITYKSERDLVAYRNLAKWCEINATKTGGCVFWSGGDVAKNAARDFAKSNGMKTLEMTTGGRIMNSVSPYLPRSISSPIWDGLSGNFARSASGNINVFQNAAGVSLRSTWTRIEYPIIQNNNIFYNIVK